MGRAGILDLGITARNQRRGIEVRRTMNPMPAQMTV
jgi:hypothetical protein